MASVGKNDSTRNPQTAERRILKATVLVLARDGLDGLSIRRVAAEADVSIGGVQHHYVSKEALLLGASEFISEQFKERAATLSDSMKDNRSVEAFVAFCQLLANAEPDSDNERGTTPSIVWLWYAAQATRPGAVAETFTAAWTETENYLHDRFALLFPNCEAREEAGYLLALLDGLAVARAAEPSRMPPERARSIIQRHFNRLDRERVVAIGKRT